MATQTGWRTLAEPTYGVTESGGAMRLEAGTLLQPYDAKGVDPGTGCGVKRGPEGTSTFLFKDAEGWDEPGLAYLTASALRFEEDHEAHGVCGSCGNAVHRYPFGWQHVGTGMRSCPAIDPQATCCPEHAQQDGEQPRVPSHEVEAREYMAEQNRLAMETS